MAKTAAKGTIDNPYSMSECDSMLDAGTWPGGYVRDDAGTVSYVMKSVTVWGYSGCGSGCDWHGSDYEFCTGSYEWHEPDTDEKGSEDDKKDLPTGNEGGTGTGGNTGGGTGGGHSNSGSTLPKEPQISMPSSIDKSGIRITAKRYIMTEKCTVSVFCAQAYAEDGNILKEFLVKGYFLERPYNADLAEKSGRNRAIQPGKYKVIPKVPGQSFKWYLEGVPGRLGIAIHAGNVAEDSAGCLLVGTSLVKLNSQEYKITGSTNKLKSLFSLFDMYGEGNIYIEIIQ